MVKDKKMIDSVVEEMETLMGDIFNKLKISQKEANRICIKVISSHTNFLALTTKDMVKEEDFDTISSIVADITTTLLHSNEIANVSMNKFKEITDDLYKIVVDLNGIYVKDKYRLTVQWDKGANNMRILLTNIDKNQSYIVSDYNTKILLGEMIMKLTSTSHKRPKQCIKFNVKATMFKSRKKEETSLDINLNPVEIADILNKYNTGMNKILGTETLNNIKSYYNADKKYSDQFLISLFNIIMEDIDKDIMLEPSELRMVIDQALGNIRNCMIDALDNIIKIENAPQKPSGNKNQSSVSNDSFPDISDNIYEGPIDCGPIHWGAYSLDGFKSLYPNKFDFPTTELDDDDDSPYAFGFKPI